MVYYGFSPGFNFSYLSTGQEIGWKERLRQSINQSIIVNIVECVVVTTGR